MTKGSRHVFVGNKPIVREKDLPQCGGQPDHKKAHYCFVGTGHMSAIRTIKTGKVQPAPRHLVTARGGDATHPHHAPGAHPIHAPTARPHHAPHFPLVPRSVCFVPTPTPFAPYPASWQSLLKVPTPGQSSMGRAPHYTPLQRSLLSAQAKAVLAREGLTAWFTGIPGRAAAAAREMDQGLQDPNQNPRGFHPGLLTSGLAHMVIDTARAGVPVIKDLFSDPSDPYSTSRAGTKQEDLDNFVDKAILFHPAVASTVAVAGVLQPAADPIGRALSAYHKGDRAGALHLLKTAPGAVGEYARQNKLETALAAAGVLHAPILRAAARKAAGARAASAAQETAAVRKMSPAHEAMLLKAKEAQKAHERSAAGQGGQSGLSSPVIGKPFHTGAGLGLDPTPETIRVGTVRMEQHPGYAAMLAKIRDAGFEIREINEYNPSVCVHEIVDQTGKPLRVEKYVAVCPGMRYIDLEHEVGHVEQLTERFGGRVPLTDRYLQRANGRIVVSNLRGGVLTYGQNAIAEFHNRMVELFRLKERGAPPELLKEHLEGLDYWQKECWEKGLKKRRGPEEQIWVQEHFPDFDSLDRRYQSDKRTTPD